MIACLCGTHSTGKSTLVDFFRHDPGIICIDSVTRDTITPEERRATQVTDETQKEMCKAILNKSIEVFKMEEEHPENVYLLDRSYFDFVGYTKAFRKRGLVSEDLDSRIEQDLPKYAKHYDLMIYLTPEFNTVDDGIRSLDESLRTDVNTNIYNLLLWYGGRTINPTGSVKQRAEMIRSAINKLREEE